MSTQAEFPLEPDAESPESPEFGLNPLALFAAVKRIRAELVAIKAFLVKIAPVLDAVKAAMGQNSPGAPGSATAPGEFSMHAEQIESMP